MTTPAVEVRSFAVTIPAGTPLASPVTESIAFPARIVTAVHWKVPPGPAGEMGWRLTMSGGVPVIPTGGGWVITDNDSDTWPLQGQPDSGQWEVTGYNTGGFPHTVYLDFLLDLITAAPQPVTLASNAAVSSPGSVTTPEPVSVPPLTVPPGTIPAITTPAGVTVPLPLTVPAITTPADLAAAAGG